MSRKTSKGVRNLSASPVSLSEKSDASDLEDGIDDDKVERILSREIASYEMLDVLPPTPKRPTTRSMARSSVSPAFSVSSVTSSQIGRMMRVPPPLSPMSVMSVKSTGRRNECCQKKNGGRGRKKKKSMKDMCQDLNLDVDDSELEDIEDREWVIDERPRVDNVIDDLLGLGLGKKKAPGGVKESTVEDEKLREQIQKLRTKKPLDINGDGRCGVLKEDLNTVKTTLDGVNALISVLEKTRDKLIDEDKNLVFTTPPYKVQKQKRPEPKPPTYKHK